MVRFYIYLLWYMDIIHGIRLVSPKHYLAFMFIIFFHPFLMYLVPRNSVYYIRRRFNQRSIKTVYTLTEYCFPKN